MRILYNGLISIIFAFFMYFNFISYTNWKAPVLLLVGILLFLLFFLINRLLLMQLSGVLKVFSVKRIIIILIFSLCFSVIFYFAFSLNTRASSLFSATHYTEVSITALGESQELAKGSEVWLTSLMVDDREIHLSDQEFSHDNSWKNIDGMLEASLKNAQLTWKGKVNSKVSLTFISHPWSGKVKISFNNETIIKDLYNPGRSTIEVGHQYPDINGMINNLTNMVIDVLFMFLLLSEILILLSKKEENSWIFRPLKKSWIIFCSLPISGVYFVYLLSFYPGNMSADSLSQWSQAHALEFTNWLPVYHTFIVWFFYTLFSNPVSISIFQIIFLSLCQGYAYYKLLQLGVSRKIVFLLMVIFSFSLINGMMSVTLWKDVLFGGFNLLLVVFLFNIYASNFTWLASKRNMFVFIFVLFNIAQIRHNGILTVIGVLIILLVIYRNQFKKNIFILFSVFSLIGVFTFTTKYILQVEPAPAHFSLGFQLQQIAALYHDKAELTLSESGYFEKILPAESWKGEDSYFSRYTANFIIFHEKINSEILNDKVMFMKNWFSAVIRNPSISFNDWFSMNSLIWEIVQPADGYLYTVPTDIDKNIFGLQQNSVLPELKQTLTNFVSLTNNPKINWIFWRPAIYFYLIVLCGFLLMIKNKLRIGIVVLPVVVEALGLMITNPAQDVRYFYSVFLIAPFVLALLVFPKHKGNV